MAKLLRQWRLAANLTQRQLAERLKRPHSYVWKTETSERRIDPIEFAAWARACRKSPSTAIEEVVS